jgi:hypothetical protein
LSLVLHPYPVFPISQVLTRERDGALDLILPVSVKITIAAQEEALVIVSKLLLIIDTTRQTPEAYLLLCESLYLAVCTIGSLSLPSVFQQLNT